MLSAAVLGWALGIWLAPTLAAMSAYLAPRELAWAADPALRIAPRALLSLALGLGIASATGLATIYWRMRRPAPDRRVLRWVLGVSVVGPGALWALERAPQVTASDVALLAPRHFVSLEAVIAIPPARTEDGWRTRIAVTRCNSYPPGDRQGLAEATLPNGPRPGVGMRWVLSGHLDRPQAPHNPGETDRAARLARQGVFATFQAEQARELGPASGWGVARQLDALRLALLNGLACGLSPQRAALLGSLVLGTGASPVDPALADHFRDIGLSHLLAASGAQVGMLSAVGYAGARLIGLAPSWAAALTLPALLVYLELTGAPASMVRATLMGAVTLGGLAMERSTAPFAALWLAAGAMLLFDPGALYDLGFQFSFLATYALCRLAAQKTPEAEDTPVIASDRLLPGQLASQLAGWARGSLRISWAANLWVLPWQLYVFQQGSFLALPANLLAEPLVLLLTPWGVGVAIAGALCPAVARLVSPLTNALLALLECLVTALACIPWGAFWCPALAPGVIALTYVALMVGRNRPVWFSCTLLALAVAACLPRLAPQQLELAFLSVGQGDAIVIHAPGGHWAVIDAGPAFRGQDAGRQVLVPFLRREGCRRIDLVVASHAHLDHIGGLPALGAALPVAHAWDPGQLDHGRPYLDVLGAWLSGDVQWAVATAGDTFALGAVHLEVLSRPAPRAPLNDGSIVLKLRYGRFTALFTGDTEAAGEARLLASGADLSAQVLKVGHHGSRTSSTRALLAAVRPELAVISVGRHNRFGHPDKEVVDRLELGGAQVERTDEDGAALVRSDGVSARLATGRDGWSSWTAIRRSMAGRSAAAAERSATQGFGGGPRGMPLPGDRDFATAPKT